MSDSMNKENLHTVWLYGAFCVKRSGDIIRTACTDHHKIQKALDNSRVPGVTSKVKVYRSHKIESKTTHSEYMIIAVEMNDLPFTVQNIISTVFDIRLIKITKNPCIIDMNEEFGSFAEEIAKANKSKIIGLRDNAVKSICESVYNLEVETDQSKNLWKIIGGIEND